MNEMVASFVLELRFSVFSLFSSGVGVLRFQFFSPMVFAGLQGFLTFGVPAVGVPAAGTIYLF